MKAHVLYLGSAIALASWMLLPDILRAQDNGQNPRRIAVEGQATTAVEADVASVHFTLNVSAPTLEECKRSYDAQLERLLASIESSGVDVATVDMGKVDVTPEYTTFGTKRSLLLYKFTSTITVYLRDVSMVTTFLGSAVSDGGAVVSYVDYAFSGEQRLRDSLQVVAIDAAKRRAQLFVEVSGGTLRAPTWIETRRNKGQQTNSYASSYGRQARPSSKMIWVTEQVEVFFEIE